jgi:uncharacterized membrane protein
MHVTKIPYVILLVATTLWCALAISPVIVVPLWPGSSFTELVYGFFARICHQMDSHSLHVFGVKFAVCERCIAIYAGMLLGVLLVPILPVLRTGATRSLWLLAVAPMLADVLLNASPWYTAGVVSRLITGGYFGLAAGLLLVPPFISAYESFVRRPHPSLRRAYEPTTR